MYTRRLCSKHPSTTSVRRITLRCEGHSKDGWPLYPFRHDTILGLASLSGCHMTRGKSDPCHLKQMLRLPFPGTVAYTRQTSFFLDTWWVAVNADAVAENKATRPHMDARTQVILGFSTSRHEKEMHTSWQTSRDAELKNEGRVSAGSLSKPASFYAAGNVSRRRRGIWFSYPQRENATSSHSAKCAIRRSVGRPLQFLVACWDLHASCPTAEVA